MKHCATSINSKINEQWESDLESYPAGSKLGMIAFDNKNLWEAGGAFIPTLAWLLEEQGSIFDTFWPFYSEPHVYSDRWFGNFSAEHIGRVNNYFDTTWYCLGDGIREMLYPACENKRVESENYIETYDMLLKNCKVNVNTAVILPVKHEWDGGGFTDHPGFPVDSLPQSKVFRWLNGYPLDRIHFPSDTPVLYGKDVVGRGVVDPTFPPGFYGRLHLYACPEIYYRKALGFMDNVDPTVLKKFGITKVLTWMTSNKKWEEAGFDVETIDSIGPNDRPWDITERVLQRHHEKVRGICYGLISNEQITPSYMGMMMRSGYFGVYDPDWHTYLPKAANWAKSVGNPRMLGTGENWNHGYWDYMTLLGVSRRKVPSTRCVPSIVRGIRQPLPSPKTTPWKQQYSDEDLQRFALEGKVGVCLNWTCNELPYSGNLGNQLDFMLSSRAHCGFEFTLGWLEFLPQHIQKAFSSTYSNFAEPMLHDWGACKTFPDTCLHQKLGPEAFRKCIELTRQATEEILGKEYFPHGYMANINEGTYPLYKWTLDRLKDGKVEHLNVQSLIPGCWTQEEYLSRSAGLIKQKCDILKEFGIRYYFGTGEFRDDGDLTFMPTRFAGDDLTERGVDGLDDFINETFSKAGYISWNFDTGLIMLTSAGLHINAVDMEGDMPEIYSNAKHYAGQLSLPERYRLMYWIAKGGNNGRVVSMKPVELTRYARLLEGCKNWEKRFFNW